MPKFNIIRSLEKSLGEKLPDNIGQILSLCGFSCRASIRNLNDNSYIRLIERYVNENRDKFNSVFEKTVYKNSNEFKFLPGHEALLQALPQELEKIEKKIRVRRKRRYSETEEQPTVQQTEFNCADTVDDSQTKSKKIKQKLIDRVNSFAAKKNELIEKFSENNITNFRFENSVYKCSASCLYCQKVIPCNHNSTYWECGNYTTHLATHFVRAKANLEANNSSDETVPINVSDLVSDAGHSAGHKETRQTVRFVKFISNTELNKILNEGI